MIKKFEEAYKVKVTITDYDSNDTALAKVRAGGHGFDIVVPSGNFMPIWIKRRPASGNPARPDGKLQERGRRWVNVDLGSRPPLYRSVAVGHRSVSLSIPAIYKGDINTWAIGFNTPDELVGKVNVAPEMNDVMYAAISTLAASSARPTRKC